MAEPDPLAHPVWSALTQRQAPLAIVHGLARRFDPEIGVFAATPDWSDESVTDLRALVRTHGPLGVVLPDALPFLPGLVATPQGLCVQMVAKVEVPFAPPGFAFEDLTGADAPEMLALATLTKPGPFFVRTHVLGDFVGVKVDGRLVAMAGERMRPDGYTEISAVCTHPDARGRGYAAGLMHVVMHRIRRRGEVPFLHVYASNAGAIRLYETLGFSVSRDLEFVALAEG